MSRASDAAELYKNGLSNQEIANELGIGYQSVKTYLRRAGISKRRVCDKSASQNFRVISVPDDIFVVGARFDKTNVDCTLQIGAWPIGLQFLDVSTGKVFEVRKRNAGQQYLKLIGKNAETATT